MMEAIMSLRQEFSLLFWSSVYTAILLVPSLALLIFDSRVVVGANPWVKPVKFELSIGREPLGKAGEV
ncbi:MAG: hypothetical protein NTV52_31650 [Acidobacteria bacterium]|nr:hypothetical protein [Acidobacteriota bacterium]